MDVGCSIMDIDPQYYGRWSTVSWMLICRIIADDLQYLNVDPQYQAVGIMDVDPQHYLWPLTRNTIDVDLQDYGCWFIVLWMLIRSIMDLDP